MHQDKLSKNMNLFIIGIGIALLVINTLGVWLMYRTYQSTQSSSKIAPLVTNDGDSQASSTTPLPIVDPVEAAKDYYIWPDKKTPTLEIDAGTLNGLQSETLEQLDGKSVVYEGQYVSELSPIPFNLLDGILVVNTDTLGNPEILEQLSGTKTRVKVWGVFHLRKNLHGESYILDAGKIELVTDETPASQATVHSYTTVTSQELWDRRSDLSGKKISLSTELDTDTMILQPSPFTSPIELTRDTEIDYLVDKDLWPRNMGKQTVTIQGTFFHNLSIEETGKTHEFYKIVVDSMVILNGITKEQALQIAQDEARKESNGDELLKLETEITESEGAWHVSFLNAEGKGATIGGGLPEYVIDAKTGEVLSRLLQR